MLGVGGGDAKNGDSPCCFWITREEVGVVDVPQDLMTSTRAKKIEVATITCRTSRLLCRNLLNGRNPPLLLLSPPMVACILMNVVAMKRAAVSRCALHMVEMVFVK